MESSLSTIHYSVPAMSCGHCVSAITQEVSAVTGVSDVAVDLDAKLVVVTGVALEDDALLPLMKLDLKLSALRLGANSCPSGSTLFVSTSPA
jgi:copper chaperone